jgi:hypothetical protein
VGAFVKVPGSEGDAWASLFSIPGLQQQSATDILSQSRADGIDPRLAETVGWDAGTSAMDWLTTVGTISAGFAAGGAAIGIFVDAVEPFAAVGGAVGALIGIPVATAVELRDYLDANRTEPITETQPAAGTQPTTQPTKSYPTPDGADREPIESGVSKQYNNLVDPVEGVGEAVTDLSRFIRLLIGHAITKVNPNPDGGTNEPVVIGDPTFGGLVGGDPVDDQPIIYTDTSPGGNPLILFFPPKTPIGK